MHSTTGTLKTFFYRLQTKLRESNIFTHVCDSVHKGRGVSNQVVSLSRGSLSRRPSRTVEERAVRILLECILVLDIYSTVS